MAAMQMWNKALKWKGSVPLLGTDCNSNADRAVAPPTTAGGGSIGGPLFLNQVAVGQGDVSRELRKGPRRSSRRRFSAE